jgi:hypothetical protein
MAQIRYDIVRSARNFEFNASNIEVPAFPHLLLDGKTAHNIEYGDKI